MASIKNKKRKKRKLCNNLITGIILILAVLILAYLSAKQPLPSPPFIEDIPSIHQFYGNINWANQSKINSGKIYAKIDNINKANTSILSSGEYDLYVENAEENSTIEFYFNTSLLNVKIGEAKFKAFELNQLDFIVDYCGDGFCSSSEGCSSCAGDCQACPPDQPPGGGGGGGGGGGDNPSCASKGYVCGNWSIGNIKLTCGVCSEGKICNATGKCMVSQQISTCQDSCSSIGFNCGTQIICNQQVDCGACDSSQECLEGICREISETPAKNYMLFIFFIILSILIVAAIIIIISIKKSNQQMLKT